MKSLQKFNPKIFWILVYTVREFIFRNFSADFSFYWKKIGNHHLNHVLSDSIFRYVVWYIASLPFLYRIIY